MSQGLNRRNFLGRTFAGAGTLLLGGCDDISEKPWLQKILASAETLNRWVHRGLLPNALAPEYSEADLSPQFKANGSTDPQDKDYRDLVATNFMDWRLEIGGLVERPLSFSLADLRALAWRTQITRHDCVEGWSCIGKWTGVPLSTLLEQVGVKAKARYAIFYCADTLGSNGDKYYESIDMIDAYHPQTILAYEMNGKTLTVPHGAPLRLRVERQLGYKIAKYIMRIELAESFGHAGGGKGGFWEDRGYEWYAGI